MSEAILRADVVVVGAGPAGSAAAGILARRGWDVLLVNRAAFPRDKACGGGPTPRAMPVLDRLGLLPTLRARGCQVVHGARLFAPDGAEWRLRFADFNLALESAELPAGAADAALRSSDIRTGLVASYTRMLDAHYASYFRGMRLLRRLATSQKAINTLIRQALRKPYRASVIAGINQAIALPAPALLVHNLRQRFAAVAAGDGLYRPPHQGLFVCRVA